MYKRSFEWNETLPSELRIRWEAWLQDLKNHRLVKIQRRFIPDNIGSIEKIELLHFSDVSNTECGQCSCIRIVAERNVRYTLVVGKARVALTKVVTVLRLELVAATVSAVVSNFLKNELDLKVDQEFFWADSKSSWDI